MGLLTPLLAPRRPTPDDDEIIDLTDRLAPYASSALRMPEPQAPAEPDHPEPATWDPAGLELDWVVATTASEELAHHEELAPEPTVIVSARPRQPRNEPCACGSGRKYKRCCGAPNTATNI
jgi:uncharacterized protein YecA (UPF0149 family)